MPGAQCARTLACKLKKAHERSHHGHTGNTRHSPRDGFTAYNVLSPVTGLFCHRRHAGLTLRNLTPASGRQDHTTSPSALASLALRHQHVHRIPHPTSVAIARTPSFGCGTAKTSGGDLPDGTSEIFFARGLDMNSSDLPVGQITVLLAQQDARARVQGQTDRRNIAFRWPPILRGTP